MAAIDLNKKGNQTKRGQSPFSYYINRRKKRIKWNELLLKKAAYPLFLSFNFLFLPGKTKVKIECQAEGNEEND